MARESLESKNQFVFESVDHLLEGGGKWGFHHSVLLMSESTDPTYDQKLFALYA